MLEARTAVAALRAATAPDHDRVDAAYGAFDLADRIRYAVFLRAHARALPAAEAALAARPGLPDFRRRAPLLADDLAALGEPAPAPLRFALPKGEAAGRLWDGTVLVAGTPGFFEIKRSRTAGPQFD